jgi:biopolymer transport protein ExbD
MVATPMLKQENGLQVELPRGDVKEVDDNQAQDIVVALDKSGKFFLNSTPVLEKDIVERISFTIGKKGDQTVFVKADTSVHYGAVIKLVDDIKQVKGVRYVALATTKTT